MTYANEVLVSTDWVAQHADERSVVVAEVDENPDLCAEGHIPGAVALHWKAEMQQQVVRDASAGTSSNARWRPRGSTSAARSPGPCRTPSAGHTPRSRSTTRCACAATRCSTSSARMRTRSSTSASPQEYSGELIAMPGYEQEGAQRGGHIPRAKSIPWAQAVREDGTYKPADELRRLCAELRQVVDGVGQPDRRTHRHRHRP
jgi:thiosulfate/3-mercaptopyruvate sulfurtransferase